MSGLTADSKYVLRLKDRLDELLALEASHQRAEATIRKRQYLGANDAGELAQRVLAKRDAILSDVRLYLKWVREGRA